MMNDTFTEKISLWLDNELNPAEVAELKTHLATCPSCQQAYQAMQQVDALFRTAATTMVAPGPGFSQRFDRRLAQRRAGQTWRVWPAVAALLIGSGVIFVTLAVAGGLSLVVFSSSLLDAGLFYQWLTAFINSVASLRALLNLVSLFLKAGYITIQQPLFWAFILIAIVITGLWVRVMQTVSRRPISTTEFVF